MINKEFIFDKIGTFEGTPLGKLELHNDNIYCCGLSVSFQSKASLQELGVPAELTTKLNLYFGQIGEDAKKALLKKQPIFTSEGIQSFFQASIRLSIQEVSGAVGNDVFRKLSDPAQAVLVSLWRQFGRLSRFESPALVMVSKMLIRGHITPAIRCLEDEQGWSAEDRKFMARRLKEATLLKNSIGEDQ